jgi:hypothetical protein
MHESFGYFVCFVVGDSDGDPVQVALEIESSIISRFPFSEAAKGTKQERSSGG